MPETKKFPSRRTVLGSLAGAGIAASVEPAARAAGVSGSRTLVCLYSFEGNDSNNMVVPLDSGRYASYARSRGSLALPESSLLTAPTVSGAQIGFHPSMPEMRDSFAARRLAVVANTGDPAQIKRSLIDPDLDYLAGAVAAPRWAGAFSSSGKVSSDARLAKGGIMRFGAQSGDTGKTVKLRTQFPDSSTGAQLQRVALELARNPRAAQFFLVPIRTTASGKDQLSAHAAGMRNLSEAMAAFFDATVELGISLNVTTYTDAAFNRTMAPDARGRSSPAWGGHQLVMGGSVIGGEVYGAFPDFTLGGADDASNNGVWIPRIASARYHANLARWSGVPDWEIRTSLPTVNDSAQLGFLS